MFKILIAEDDKDLASMLKDYLDAQGYSADISSTLKNTYPLLLNNDYDLCLLDIGFPDGSGFELCENIKPHFKGSLIILTAHDSEDEIVKGFSLGADDYVSKPFSLRILKARIEAQLKKNQNHTEDILYSGDLTIDFVHNMIFKNNIEIPLGGTEFHICKALILQKGRILPRNLLLNKLWDSRDVFVEENTLTVHISRIRKKLGTYNGLNYIETAKNIGYRWNLELRSEK